MSKRLLDLVAPVRPAYGETGYRRLLRWAALPVTDRRWAAPLCAIALGFGLFAGVAIGPGTTGSLATGAPQVIEMPSLLAAGDDGGGGEGEESAEAGGFSEPGGGGGESEAVPLEAESSTFASAFPEVETPQPPAHEAVPTDEGEAEEAPQPEEEAQVLTGVVVHANPAAASYTLVEAGGLMSAVHAAKLPAAGAKLSVSVRTLANGTFAEVGKRKQTGVQSSASLAGVVTFVDADPAAPAYAVSKRGVSLLIRIHPDPSGAMPVLPQLGAYATVAVAIEKAPPEGAAPLPVAVPAEAPPGTVPASPPTCAPDPAQPPAVPAATALLWQTELDADGAPFASSDFEGVVTAICPAEAKLAISGDDLRQAGKDILFTVPASIDPSGLQVGDSVAASAAIEADGSLRLTGLASDERTKGADDVAATQGDLASHAPK